MTDDDRWAEYARLQQIADSSVLSGQTWAAEEGLDTILDKIEQRQAVTARQADNLLINRAAKRRHRRRLLARQAHLFADTAANENARLDARSELDRHRSRCTAREWRVLVSVGVGDDFSSIATIEHVPVSTVKTWVRRVRARLLAV